MIVPLKLLVKYPVASAKSNAGVASVSPNEKLIPPILILEFANFPFAIEPANIAFVTPVAAILKFSEPSSSKPVPAKSETSIFNVTAESEFWLVVNVPPVFKPSPAVIVNVEFSIPANSDT